MVVLAFLAAPRVVSPVHAQTTVGTVCVVPLDAVATGSVGAPCKSGVDFTNPAANNATGVTFNGPPPTASNQLIVGVFINVTDTTTGSYLGFDITVKADPAVLTPADADLVGSTLTAATVNVKCIGGHLHSSSGVCPSTDTLDTIHFGASQSNTITAAGLLFRAIWNITGTTNVGTPISVHFQTGCGTSSAKTSIAPGVNSVCITMLNGGSLTTPIAETFRASSFDNSAATTPYVTVSATIGGVVTTSFGTRFVGDNTVTATLTYKSHNAFNDAVTLSATTRSFANDVSGTSPTCSASVSPGSVTPPVTGNVNSTLTMTAVGVGLGPGQCGATVYGSYNLGTLEGFANSTFLTAPITFSVNFVDFTVAANPTLVTFLATGSGQSTVTVGSQNGFAGNVNIAYTTTTLTTPRLLNGTTPNPIAVPAGGTPSAMTTFSGGAGGTSYAVTLRATSTIPGTTFTRLKTVLMTVAVQDFSVQVTGQTSLVFNAGGSGSTTTFTVSSKPSTTNGFTGTITISTLVNATGLTVNCPPNVSLTTAGSTSAAQTCSFNSSTGGGYNVTVTGSATASGATVTHSVTVIVTVNDFSVTASPSTITVVAGVSGTSTVTVSSKGAFNQAVSLTAPGSPSGLTCTLTPTSVTPPSAGSGTSTLSCSGPSGSYSVTVTGTSTGLPARTSAVAFTVQDFTVTASSRSVSVDTGSPGASTVTITAASGFSGTVTLMVIAPSGVTASLSPTSVMGSGSSTLTMSSSTAGTYTLNVTASSGSLSHSLTVTLTVTSPSNVFGLSATEFYSIVGIVVVVAAVSAVVFLRRRRPGKPPQAVSR